MPVRVLLLFAHPAFRAPDLSSEAARRAGVEFSVNVIHLPEAGAEEPEAKQETEDQEAEKTGKKRGAKKKQAEDAVDEVEGRREGPSAEDLAEDSGDAEPAPEQKRSRPAERVTEEKEEGR